MKRFFIFTALIFLLGCHSKNINNKKKLDLHEEKRQGELFKKAHQISPLPTVHNFQERQLLKKVYELRDSHDIITYVYYVNQKDNKLNFVGKSIGFNIPIGTLYSSNLKVEDYTSKNYLILPQAEPNGLYVPQNGPPGNWLMILDEKGVPRPFYTGAPVIVSSFPLH